MSKLTRKEFADIAEEYIRKLNEIADKQGFSVITAFDIEGTEAEPIDYSIDWRNMCLNENLHALARWTQDIMNSYDEEEEEELEGEAPFGDYPAKY